ncbi:MAG: Crp/Fnr family transcriptional regulator, partial [Rubrivivax sp.]|nr:Crp/Fnr family transcriptional regulator [Rubrivivax sp.]
KTGSMSCQQVPTAPAFNPYPRSVQVGEFEVAIGGGIWVAIGVLTVGKAAVLGEIAANPDFSLRMLAGLARRLHGLVKDVEAYTLHSGVQRVIGYLLGDRVSESEVASESITVSLPVSKAAIASRLSLTPEYFSRVLNELETAGLIQVDKRDIRIPDTARLANHQPL